MYLVSYFGFQLLISQITGLIELPSVDDNSILKDNRILRDTVNKLFATLNVSDFRKNQKLVEYSAVNKHLMTYTLDDFNNLNEIKKLTRVVNGTSEIEYFTATLNELLDEDKIFEYSENAIDTDKDYVVKYIRNFLVTLENLKDEHGVRYENHELKKDVYNILKDEDSWILDDTLSETNKSLSDENDFWKPANVSSGRRVFLGTKTKVKYFPFMASIHIFNKFHCAGSIVKSDLVISASSCMQLAWNNRFFRENPVFLSVRVGSTFYNGGGENIPVLEVYFHPNYDPKTLRNNICLLRLVRRLKFRRRAKRIKKIEIDRRSSPLPVNTDGITILGWGARRMSNIIRNPWHNRLSFDVLDFYPLLECQDVYSKEYVTRKNFCAGFFSKGGGACNGDVGGPGVVNGVLVGVVSFGSPVCGTPDAPTVFTKVGYYADWIEEIMEMKVPSAKMRTTLKPQRIFTSPRYYTTETPTTFKMQPLRGHSNINEASEDVLEVDEESVLFKEYLKTVFDSKEREMNQDVFGESKIGSEKVKDKMAAEKHMELSAEEISQFDTVTKIIMDSKESNELETNSDENVHATALIPFDPLRIYEPVAATTVASTIDEKVKMTEEDKKLEEALVNLIDTIDLEQIIQNISSFEEEKILRDPEFLDLLESETKKSLSNIDNSVLFTNLKVNESRNLENMSSSIESTENDEDGGLSIDTQGFNDMNFRRLKQEEEILYNFLPKLDLYYILSGTENKKNKTS